MALYYLNFQYTTTKIQLYCNIFYYFMRAILFPGQGSQYIGMGLDFYKKFDSVH